MTLRAKVPALTQGFAANSFLFASLSRTFSVLIFRDGD